jgi:iron complex outermembrane recepter protein
MVFIFSCLSREKKLITKCLNFIFSNFCYILIIFLSVNVTKAQDTIPNQTITEILLTGSRTQKQFVWSFDRDTLKDIDLFQSSLKQVLDRQAGIQAFNGENFAQDVRISIRGYGSRSAFGIRGIRLYQDGIPLTSPDGTTQLDEISGFDIQSLDILRSGLSARLGNSSGSAIAIKSAAYANGGSLLAQTNPYGTVNAGIKYGFSNTNLANVTSINHHLFNGKRAYSQSINTTFYNKLRYYISDKWEVEWLSGLYWSPKGTDPGALNTTEIAANRYAANSRNSEFLAGESVKGLMTALVSKYYFNEKTTFLSNIFYRKRDFEARLPFESGGWINLDRDFSGTNQSIIYQIIKNGALTFGSSLEYQNDHRVLYQNKKGQKGLSSANQFEKVLNVSIYQQTQWTISKWDLHQLLRWDYNHYKLSDRFEDDGIQNGNQSFKNVNSAVGVSYKFSEANHMFSNFSTTFEMPSLNELTNNPNGVGFNPALAPEKSWQVELGQRWTPMKQFNIQTSLFYIQLKDQIVAYELPNSPGRSFYRNASASDRKGIEFSASYIRNTRWRMDFNYTWSAFRYTNFMIGNLDFSGNQQTLIPKHKFQLNSTLPVTKWIDAQINFAYNSSLWLDDANTQSADAFGELNTSIATTPAFSKKISVGLLGNNLFNLMPYSNFRANAVALRYFEVATPMYFGLFVKLKYPK